MGIAEKDIARFLTLPSGNICDANGKGGNLHESIKPLNIKLRMAGPAVTVKCYPGDNLTIHKAIYEAEPGSVLVIDVGGYSAGHLGEIMVRACMKQGLKGIVIDGGCRDSAEIRELSFPVFCRSVNPGGTVKESVGRINCTVSCGGIVIHPGDIIVGDCDGVVAVSEEKYEEVLEKAEEISKSEARVMELIEAGKSTLEIFGLDKILKNKGF